MAYKKIAMKDRVRVDTNTKLKIHEMRCEIEKIEKSRIPDGEVVRRIMSGIDIPDRLRIGAYQRRKR